MWFLYGFVFEFTGSTGYNARVVHGLRYLEGVMTVADATALIKQAENIPPETIYDHVEAVSDAVLIAIHDYVVDRDI